MNADSLDRFDFTMHYIETFKDVKSYDLKPDGVKTNKGSERSEVRFLVDGQNSFI